MSKTINQAILLCVEENHEVEGLFVEEGRNYVIRQDNYGQFIEDNNGDEHYLSDFDWQSIFTLIN